MRWPGRQWAAAVRTPRPRPAAAKGTPRRQPVAAVRWPLWPVAVAERSMEPALRPGDWLLAWRGLRPGGLRRVRRGQVVIARHPGGPDMLIVKRAVREQSGGWWLASDNPAAGAVDSRAFGPVPPDLIEGRVLFRYWPMTGR